MNQFHHTTKKNGATKEDQARGKTHKLERRGQERVWSVPHRTTGCNHLRRRKCQVICLVPTRSTPIQHWWITRSRGWILGPDPNPFVKRSGIDREDTRIDCRTGKNLPLKPCLSKSEDGPVWLLLVRYENTGTDSEVVLDVFLLPLLNHKLSTRTMRNTTLMRNTRYGSIIQLRILTRRRDDTNCRILLQRAWETS